MCKNHDKVFGKNALVMYVEAQFNPKTVCSARLKYLENQAESFKTWLKGVNPAQAENIVENIERQTWKILREDVQDEFIWSREDDEMQLSLYDTMHGKEVVDNRLDEEKYMFIAYQMNMEEAARKAFEKHGSDCSYIEQQWLDWLQKVDAVYYASNNYLPKEWWNKCQKARLSLSRQFKAKALDYHTFALLSNWNNRLSGNKKRFEVQDLPMAEDFDEAEVALVYYTRD